MTMDLKDVDVAKQKLATAYEELAAELTIEQRLAGLTPEQFAAALPPEVLELIACTLKS